MLMDEIVALERRRRICCNFNVDSDRQTSVIGLLPGASIEAFVKLFVQDIRLRIAAAHDDPFKLKAALTTPALITYEGIAYIVTLELSDSKSNHVGKYVVFANPISDGDQ